MIIILTKEQNNYINNFISLCEAINKNDVATSISLTNQLSSKDLELLQFFLLKGMKITSSNESKQTVYNITNIVEKDKNIYYQVQFDCIYKNDIRSFYNFIVDTINNIDLLDSLSLETIGVLRERIKQIGDYDNLQILTEYMQLRLQKEGMV